MITTAVLDTMLTIFLMTSLIKVLNSALPIMTVKAIAVMIAVMILIIRILAFRKIKLVVLFRVLYSIFWSLTIFSWLSTQPIRALILPIFIIPWMILTAMLSYVIRERIRDIFDMMMHKIYARRVLRRGRGVTKGD
jgi:hypothetical protein